MNLLQQKEKHDLIPFKKTWITVNYTINFINDLDYRVGSSESVATMFLPKPICDVLESFYFEPANILFTFSCGKFARMRKEDDKIIFSEMTDPPDSRRPFYMWLQILGLSNAVAMSRYQCDETILKRYVDHMTGKRR